MVAASSIQSITRAAALGTAAIGVLSSSGLTARADDLGSAIVIDSLVTKSVPISLPARPVTRSYEGLVAIGIRFRRAARFRG